MSAGLQRAVAEQYPAVACTNPLFPAPGDPGIGAV